MNGTLPVQLVCKLALPQEQVWGALTMGIRATSCNRAVAPEQQHMATHVKRVSDVA